MTRPPSAEELKQLAKIWFAEARELSTKEQAEFEAWKKEHRKWTSSGSGVTGLGYDGGASGDCSGD